MLPPKKPLTFISEGVTDITTQQTREELKQKQFENAKLRKNRKSLEEQLRNNARKKHIEFKNKVKKRENSNKLNQKELSYYQKLQELENKQEKELNQFISASMDDYEMRKKIAERRQNVSGVDITENWSSVSEPSRPVSVVQKLEVKVKPQQAKKKKIGVKLKTLKRPQPPA